MRQRQMHLIDSLRRARAYLAANAPDPAPANLPVQTAVLDGVIADVERLAAAQETGVRLGRSATSAHRELRRALREQMLPVSRIARSVLHDVPNLHAALRMPPTSEASERLVASARAMMEAAAPYAPVFVQNGRPERFLAELGAAADALSAAQGGASTHRSRRTSATAELAAALRRGRQAVRLIDAMLRPTLATDAGRLAAWASAIHVQRAAAESVAVGTPGGGATSAAEAPMAAA